MPATGNSQKLNGNVVSISNKSQLSQVHQQQQPHQQQTHQSQQQQHQQQSQQQHQQTQSNSVATVISSSSSTNQQQQQQQQQQNLQQQVNQPSQHQSHIIPPSTHSSSSASSTSTPVAVQQHIPTSNNHHSTHHLNSQTHHQTTNIQHTIPPRYHPPPQPHGGILKHLPPTKASAYYATELGVPAAVPQQHHLSIKYPPEIPKLASVYIPESIKNSGNSSRFAQRPPTHRLSGGHIPVLVQSNQVHHHDEHLLRQLQQQHQHQQHQHQQQQHQQHQQQQQQPPPQQHHQQQQHQEMLKFVRKPDTDPSVPGVTTTASVGLSGVGPPAPGLSGATSGRLTIEQNRHLQSLLGELRALKEANQRLSDDNQELRDLCCFLDDDRQKGRKLAREWQRFGRYTASVMRQEVSAYQNKLRQLDDKQQELIRDNLELKELCLYLDEERAHVAANTLCANCGGSTRPTLRDDGDGSSSSTNAEDTISAIRQFERQLPDLNLRSPLSDQTLQYVRSLEMRIRQLEEERITTNESIQQQNSDPMSGRPEAVVRALQVLEVREQLERDRVANPSTTPEQMDDGEKALVREMCNVVWRKLEESPNGPTMDPI